MHTFLKNKCVRVKPEAANAIIRVRVIVRIREHTFNEAAVRQPTIVIESINSFGGRMGGSESLKDTLVTGAVADCPRA